MLKKTITYTDYDGNERTEDFYFNLTKAEIIEMNLMENGGLERTVRKMINETDTGKLYQLIKKIVLGAYGEKSFDGKRFIKSKELSDAFSQTEAFSQLIVEFFDDTNNAAAFIRGIIPKETVGDYDNAVKVVSMNTPASNQHE